MIGQKMDRSARPPCDSKKVKKLLQTQAIKSKKHVTDINISKKAKQVTENKQETKQTKENEGQPIHGYRILEKMGSGGTSVVFKAENIDSGDIVALKLLFPNLNQDKEILKQFISEGLILQRLQHSNILQGIDFGVSNGMYFLALELVHGESLDLFLQQGLSFTEKYTFEVALQISEALAYLQEKKMIHRDVKPANILLLSDGSVKLCDFAYAMETSFQKKKSKNDNLTCGTVEYISPEQARGRMDLDIRSDIYSLGITCIHMLSGKVPFMNDDPREVMRQQIYEKIELKKIVTISKMGRLLLKRMIAKKRENRFYADRLVHMLKKVLALPSKNLEN